MTPSRATPEQNAALLRETFAAFSAGDLDACTARIAPDFVINLAGMPPMRGVQVWRQGSEVMRHAFPDLTVRIEDLVADGDRVAVRLTLHGTHLGEFQGMPATGRTVTYSSHEFYRFADESIAEEWICSDMAGLFDQLRA